MIVSVAVFVPKLEEEKFTLKLTSLPAAIVVGKLIPLSVNKAISAPLIPMLLMVSGPVVPEF